MADARSDALTPSRPPALFVTTRWSVVLAARDRSCPDAAQALETLCRTYWYPAYAFIRSQGRPPDDAQDLAQEFFARLLAKDFLRLVQPEKGRFRTFLRMALKRFLANEGDRRRAQKRGGGSAHVAFDTRLAEQRFQSEPGGALAPDRSYDRRWALALLDEAMARLERECAATGKAAELQHLKPHLTAERGALPYADLAATLGTTEGAARVAVHRLRRRFRELFRAAIADTVAGPEEAESEFREVIQILREG
jgi:RNA polymerase sigma factor (sigma-70 family)